MSKARWSTVSLSYRQADLPGKRIDPGLGRSLSQTFLPESDPLKAAEQAHSQLPEYQRRAISVRAAQSQQPPQRPSRMVAEDRPQPVHRPSPALAHGADAVAFNDRWQRERRGARAELYASRDALLEARASLERADGAAVQAQQQAGTPSQESAAREAFKAARRAEAEASHGQSRAANALDRATRS